MSRKIFIPIVLSVLGLFSVAADDVEVTPNKVVKSVDFHAGSVHAIIENDGSMNLRYDSPERSHELNILSVVNRSMSSFFSVAIGNHEYRSNVGAVLKKFDESSFTFSSKEKFFSKVALNSVDDPLFVDNTSEVVPNKVLRIDFSVTNISERNQKFALKSYFDTVLGENSKYHFVTGSGATISSEVQYSAVEMKRELFLESSDGSVYQRFFFADYPSYLTVANKDVLQNAMCGGVAKPKSDIGRSFNSAVSYSNSAVGLVWTDFYLAPGQSKSVSFYIMSGERKLTDKEVKWIAVPSDSNDELSDADDSHIKIEESVSDDSDSAEIIADVQKLPQHENVDFVVKQVEEYQLDPTYIQSLIDRINSIQNGSVVPSDSYEIERLNAELDAILLKLKQG